MADDIVQLQRQAAQRVQRMQEHSRRVFEEYQGRTPESLEAARIANRAFSDHQAPVACDQDHPSNHPVPANTCTHTPANQQTRLFSLEIEQWLLLGLALLLYRNGCRIAFGCICRG